ncbi:hypothetical protein BU16DRAFT_528387 [Lophium mytilinum]|uniref:CENP-V/GFA domain-containing protein n=1 Tax=Lophium mytilinum TaxID=390894 RepID=A0A6A6QQ26_9PEZI|nr:hypothetical protein BU16DRAFT_528387 [Lophium mytilinum]
MCRKQTGSLVPQICAFSTASISPPLKNSPAYKTYKSSPSVDRGFCGTCGSPMTFNDEKEAEYTDIFVGVFDEDVLLGKRDEANAWEDEYGRHVPRVGGFGKELCAAKEHLFLENSIPGLTDDLPGKKWLANRPDGNAFTSKLSDFARPS